MPKSIISLQKGWDEEILDLSEPKIAENIPKLQSKFIVKNYIPRGQDFSQNLIKNSLVPGKYACFGDFENTLRLLKIQISLSNPSVLKDLIKRIYLNSHTNFTLLNHIGKTKINLLNQYSLKSPINYDFLNIIYQVFCNNFAYFLYRKV